MAMAQSRVLCVAEIRGNLSQLNALAAKHQCRAIVHTGSFGFFDNESWTRVQPATLKHVALFSPFITRPGLERLAPESDELRQLVSQPGALSELPKFLDGTLKLDVPVYTIYGTSEDLLVVEKFRDGTYVVPNLHVIDESRTHAIDLGSGGVGANVGGGSAGTSGNGELNGVPGGASASVLTVPGSVLRLFGIGGNFLINRFFDNGDGHSTIAGTHGLMWTTALQIGQLVQTVRQTFDPSEIRLFVSHPSPQREPLLTLLAIALRADFTLSSGVHFTYSSSSNEYMAQIGLDAFRTKLAAGRAQFSQVWGMVKTKIAPLVDSQPKQKLLLDTCVDLFQEKSDRSSRDHREPDYIATAFKNLWHFNLCDVQYGVNVLNFGTTVQLESYSQGFDFRYRAAAKGKLVNGVHASSSAPTPTTSTSTPTAPSAGVVPVTPSPPGLWVAHGSAPEEVIRGYFAAVDQANITNVVIKASLQRPDRKFALVFFGDEAQAQQALTRVDTQRAGRVTAIERRELRTEAPRREVRHDARQDVRQDRRTPRGGGGGGGGGARGIRGRRDDKEGTGAGTNGTTTATPAASSKEKAKDSVEPKPSS